MELCQKRQSIHQIDKALSLSLSLSLSQVRESQKDRNGGWHMGRMHPTTDSE